MNYLVLIGVLLIVVGFALKLDVVAVVLISGLVTGLVSGMSLVEVLDLIGKGFVTNRYMSLFFLSLPLIAIMERYGLKDRAAEAIKKIKSASAGGVVGLYILIRWVAAIFSLNLVDTFNSLDHLYYLWLKVLQQKLLTCQKRN